MSAPFSVHKFGGTCLADAERIENAAALVGDTSAGARRAIVVSALAGVTDALLDAARSATSTDARPAVRAVVDRNCDTARAVLGPAAEPIVDAILKDASDIEVVLEGVRVARVCSERTLELVSGYGELWSARIFCARLVASGVTAEFVDARDVLVVAHDSVGPAVVWDDTERRLSQRLCDTNAECLVITGYIAIDRDGVPTTLKRNGSDFSASIFARLLGADSITIWTDVDGVLSADPRLVPEAVLLPELSYEEAMELAYFGAKVLHPHTMAPAIESGIPIRIRNAFRPEQPGTRVAARATVSADTVRGLSLSEDLALLDVAGVGMIGVPGIASRMFAALREVDVSVRLISQASSEHSICVAIPRDQGERAKEAVQRAFAAELAHGQIQTIDLSSPYSILAAVGDGMVDTPGVSARFFGSLGKAGINVRAVAQGSSERNISAVVAEADAGRALRAVHAGFYLSQQTLSVGLIGPGLIGAALLGQLRDEAERLRDRFQIDLRVRGIASSTRMVLDDRSIDPSTWRDAMQSRAVAVDLDAFAEHVRSEHLPHAVIVDCTASDEIAARYAGWLDRGIHIVTPNKKANSAPRDAYERMCAAGRRANTHLLYEATVGAGLPIITTLRDLIQSGDRVERIEGVLSGTLSFLLNSFDGERSFSAIATEARRRGYTEPDPREDLSGVDVARKALILARELGLSLELEDIDVEGLVPEPLRDVADPDAFLAGLADFDADMERLRAQAEEDGEVLRYVAVIEADGTTAVGLRRYPNTHPFARLRGGDNVVAFTTERYHDLPLIVQGPGAGPDVTAGGVFADLLRLASYVGARA